MYSYSNTLNAKEATNKSKSVVGYFTQRLSKTRTIIMVVLTCLYSINLDAQCPSGQINVEVTYASGLFSEENSWLLWDATNGVELLCDDATAIAGTYSICADQNIDIELYAWETFGDSWNGSTISLAYNEDGLINGCMGYSNNIVYGPDGDPGGAIGNGSLVSCPGGSPSDGLGGALAFSTTTPTCGGGPVPCADSGGTPPCGLGNVQVDLIFGSGLFNGEIMWELWDETEGILLGCEPVGGFTPNTTHSYCAPLGNNLAFYPGDAFGDGWNGATAQIVINDQDNTLNGCDPSFIELMSPVIPTGFGTPSNCIDNLPPVGVPSWTGAVTGPQGCTPCGVMALSCDWTISMFDSFGDGWDAASVDISVDGGAAMNFTLTTGFSGTGTFGVVDGGTIDQVYNSGIFNDEVSWNLTDDEGVIVYAASGDPNPNPIPSITATCQPCMLDVTCPGPLNLQCRDELSSDLATQFLDAGGIINNSCNPVEIILLNEVTNGGLGCPLDPETITRTLNISDPITGENVICDLSIIIADSTGPALVCANTTASCDDDFDLIPEPIAVDNCLFPGTLISTFSDTDNQGSDPAVCSYYNYTITRTWTFTDFCNNSSQCMHDIAVSDSQPPTPFCINDITVVLDNNGMVTIDPSIIDGGSFDNCSAPENLTFSLSQATFTCQDLNPANNSCENTVFVDFLVSDPCGNSSFCITSITVIDLIPPVLSCPSNEFITLDAGECGEFYHFTEPFATDNCGSIGDILVEKISGPDNGDFLERGSYDFEYMATDACGNVTNCSWSVEVLEFPEDNQTDNLACNELVFVSLDEDCLACVRADMILEGGPYGCYDDFILEAPVGLIVPADHGTGNYICFDGNYVNQTITVTVINPDNENSCWGNVTIEDKLPPILTCDTLIINCVDGYDPLSLPIVVDENCGLYDLIHSDNILVDDDCDGVVIERSWLATDPQGLQGSCVQLITVLPPTVLDWPEPDSLIVLGCGDEIPNGIGIGQGPSVCETIVSSYSDQPIPACGGVCGDEMVKIIRTYTILDWCDALAGPTTFIQIIKRIDTVPPTIVEITGDSIVVVDPWTCTYTGDLPVAWVHDSCSTITSVLITGPVGLQIDGNQVIDAPPGVHPLTYIASDCCGNTSSQTVNIEVKDGGAPVAITKENIVVGLTLTGQDTFGVAKLFNWHIDNGSYDGCGPIRLEIRRDTGAPACGNENPNSGYNNNLTYDNTAHEHDNNQDTDDGEFVKFCCEDLTEVDDNGIHYGMVKVWLRVWDDANGSGEFGDVVPGNLGGVIEDNYNEAWTTVRVEDKTTPFINCPPDITITCDLSATDTDITGKGFALGVCGIENVAYKDSGTTDACNLGTISRTWFVDQDEDGILDNGEDFCIQQITVDPINGRFDESNIDWPDDKTVQACSEVSDDEVEFYSEECSLVGWTVEADTFYFEYGSCWKVLNYFTVIDWCQFDGDDPDLIYGNQGGEDGIVPGYWTHIQVVKFIDDDEPEVECSDQMFPVDGDCINHNVVVTNTATDEGCAGGDQAWIKWRAEVDLWGDGSIDVLWSSFTENHPHNPIVLSLSPTKSGETVSLDFSAANISIENSMHNHVVTWWAYDGCGNVTTCMTTFMVTDKKPPTPYCISLSSALMEDPDGEGPQVSMVELWACDFDLGAFDNCSDNEDMWFTFTPAGPNADYLDVPHYFNRSTADFEGFYTWPHPAPYINGDWGYWNGDNCEGSVFTECGVHVIEIYVWDEKGIQAWLDREDHTGNTDYCTVELTIGGLVCEDDDDLMANIAGEVRTEVGEGINGITMTSQTDMSDYPKSEITIDGLYTFDSNPMYHEYTISGTKSDDYMNGVSTLDLVLIQKHILGVENFDSPFKVIAADINNDQKVSAIDLLELRKLILGLYETLPNNASWRLVNVDQQFTDIFNPWPIDEVVIVSPLLDDQMHENFIGTKIGDVNLSATANVSSISSESRSNAKLRLEVADEMLEAGIARVEVTSTNFADIYGYQFTMNLSGASLLSVESGALEINDTNVGMLSSGVVTMSWNNTAGITAGSEEVLFTLVLEVGQRSSISEMLSISSKVTKAEAYVGNVLEVQGVELGLRGGEGELGVYELYQNEPNPFGVETVIGFQLPTASAAVVTIYDVTGKVVRVIRSEYDKGYNEVKISKGDLGASGVLYYQLESGDFTATKKMIVIE